MNYLGLLRVNQFSYRQLLEDKVFLVMKQTLGLSKFSWTVWQQDGAKQHQARMAHKKVQVVQKTVVIQMPNDLV